MKLGFIVKPVYYTVSVERYSPFLFVYESQNVEASEITVPRLSDQFEEQKPKEIYAGTRNFILNHHLDPISRVARHCLYRVHGIKIGEKEKKRKIY